jgi:hypothetical protein
VTARGLHDVSCVAHVHSTYSDGTATVGELVEAAKAAGRDALLLTDHDTLAARRDGWDGWHGSLLAVVGLEVSPKGGHVLAFGVENEIEHRGLGEEQILARIAASGGFGFIAHPFSRGARMSRRVAPPHGWSSLASGGFAGIELWSLVTDVAEAWRSPREAISFMRRPELFLGGPPREHLSAWDALCQRRRVAALGGLDAHQPGVRVRRRVFSPMPNERYFRLFGTHALTYQALAGDAGSDGAQLLDALREGRSYLSLDFVGDPRGFACWAEGDSAQVLMGEAVNDPGPWTIRVETPARAELRLIHDGARESATVASRLEHRVEAAGVYRAEAWRWDGGRDLLWIASNPIYLHRAPAGGAGGRAAASGAYA